MTSSSTRGTVTSSKPSSGRSFLSKLKSPLQSKTRNFADFYIQADDPHRQYAPGDIISGSVVIKVVKPLRITHLTISLHGYAQVYKNPNSPGDAYKNYSTTIGSGKGKRGGNYFGNGFASLFEDEVVLCGEGRLGEGVYHFNFELEFPSKGLPSSIEFERGTISYMLTSTLTRPTTISPTTSCDTKVTLMDVVDVAPIPEPKARVITLEPISRRGRPRTSPRKRTNAQTEGAQQSSDNAEVTRSGRVSELNSVVEETDVPGSPAPSDVSFESQFSSGQASGTEYNVRSINTTVESSSSRTTVKGKTITATIDVLKGGFLRGDQIPIKVTVSHTKHIRSLKGIIITLYRQARVDMHPALPITPNSKGDKTKSEDYYPKSRTGLGGLSLSSAGSSHLFRKDLSQSFAPLFVDPRTLTAEVKCAVRVPEEAFPTIANVPGAMISFKYYIEVVVDIQGKLAGLDRWFSNPGLMAVPSGYGNEPGKGQVEDATGSMFSTWGGNFADTDSIRREKGVISCLFEVVIGTKDSERNGKRKQIQEPPPEPQLGIHEIAPPASDAYRLSDDQGYYNYDENGQYYDHYAYDEAYHADYYDRPAYQETDPNRPPYQPPAPTEGEEELSEKERIRRAEARLLPSRPPDVAGPSSPPGTHQRIPPSAPILPDEEEANPAYLPSEPSSSQSRHYVSETITPSAPISHPPTAPSIHRRTTNDSHTTATGSSQTAAVTITAPRTSADNDAHGDKALPPLPPPSPAPQYFPSSSSAVQPTDDKQELQRRRLEMEASAPPEDRDEDEDAPVASAPPVPALQNMSLAPSAPVLDEDDEGLVGPVGLGVGVGASASRTGNGSMQDSGTGLGRRVSETLPAYQR